MLAFVDSYRFSHFTPAELKLVRDIYLEISSEAWFDHERKGECASYVIHMYQRGMVDPIRLKRLCTVAARDKYSVPQNV